MAVKNATSQRRSIRQINSSFYHIVCSVIDDYIFMHEVRYRPFPSVGLTIWQKWHMPRAPRFWGPRAFGGPALLEAPRFNEAWLWLTWTMFMINFLN
jgi:hypothetical protein